MKIRVLTLHPFKPDWAVELLERMSFLAKTDILNYTFYVLKEI